MPAGSYGSLTNDRRVLFSREFYKQALYRSALGMRGLWGKPRSGAPFVTKSEVGKEGKPGDTIKVQFQQQLGGKGHPSGANLSEAADGMPRRFDLNVTLGLVRKAVAETQVSDGKQKNYHDWKTDAIDALEAWAGRYFDIATMIHLCGYRPTSGTLTTTRYTDGTGGSRSMIDPSDAAGWCGTILATDYPAAYKIFPTTSVTDEGSINSTHIFSTYMIDTAIARARHQNYAIASTGEDKYLFILDPVQIAQLQSDTRYNAIALNDVTFRGAEKNVRLTGKIQQWQNAYIMEAPYVSPGISNAGAVVTGVARGVMCGADTLASVLGLWGTGAQGGEMPIMFTDEESNHGEDRQVGIKFYCGIQAIIFDTTGSDNPLTNPVRRNSFCLPTYYAEP